VKVVARGGAKTEEKGVLELNQKAFADQNDKNKTLRTHFDVFFVDNLFCMKRIVCLNVTGYLFPHFAKNIHSLATQVFCVSSTS